MFVGGIVNKSMMIELNEQSPDASVKWIGTKDVGIDPSASTLDLEGMKASMGLEADVESITHSELQERRQQLQKKIGDAGGVPLD